MNDVTLASILRKYFGCKKPVLKYSEPSDFDTEGRRWLTRSGQNAYGKLIHALEDVGTLLGEDMTNVIETLDEIAEGFSFGLE